MTTPPEFIANVSEVSQTAASKSTLALPRSLQYVLSSMKFGDRWIQRASKPFTAFLTSSVFAKRPKPGHVLPLFLCLVLQQSTLLAINNRTEEQKVINKPYMAKSDKTHFRRSHSKRETI